MDESQTIRVSVEEASQLLGIEKGSVKKRVQRGKLRSEKDASGAIWVYLDKSETVRDQPHGRSETDRDELVGELRDRVRSLERRLDEEGESRRRTDTIIAQFALANEEQSSAMRELERANEEQSRTIRELAAPEATETVEAEQPFGLKAASGVATWLGGILSPLAISVLNAQDDRYRTALVFAAIAGAGVFLVAAVFYARPRRRTRLSPSRGGLGGYAAGEVQESPSRSSPEEYSPGPDREPIRWGRAVAVLLVTLFSLSALSVLVWLGYLLWRVYVA